MLESCCLELVILWFIRFSTPGFNSEIQQTQFLEAISTSECEETAHFPYLVEVTDRIHFRERPLTRFAS